MTEGNNKKSVHLHKTLNEKGGSRITEKYGDKRKTFVQTTPQFIFEVLKIRPVTRVNSGGTERRMAVLCAAFDPITKKLGIGHGKATDVPGAIKKSENDAVKNMRKISLFKETISHNTQVTYKNIKVIMIQTNGKGIIAGFIPRKILSLIGIKSVTCKCIGKSKSPDLIAMAVFKCLSSLESVSEVAARLGKTSKEILERKKWKNLKIELQEIL